MSKKIPIIIPAYEPDERLLPLLSELVDAGKYIIVVNDGSGSGYNHIFEEAEKLIDKNGVLLVHKENMGKGRALKTAFSYIINNIPDAVGGVTADCDGQHNAASIEKVSETLVSNPENLILGVRSFDRKEIPWKSYFGNVITLKVFHLISGIKVSDTQTGLRGIPLGFMNELIELKEDRFEFEMQMLLMTRHKHKIKEIPIATIYESKTNHKSHFNPWADSAKIYKILFKQIFIK